MIAIIDYGMGNIRSIKNALDYLGIQAAICRDAEKLNLYSKLILPGVGSFRSAKINLEERGFIEPLEECVSQRGKHILGICLGMHLFAEMGSEDGETPGLGWLKGVVSKLNVREYGLKVPHVGFNLTSVTSPDSSKMFHGLRDASYFYYSHSFGMVGVENNYVAATAMYGEQITAAVMCRNIWGCQFHPEKSQENGLVLLRNFGRT